MKKQHTRLNNTRDCRRFLARIINDANNGVMPHDLLRTLTYSLKALVGIMRDNELEGRIESLEKPQEVKVRFPVHSEADEKLIISWLRKIELGLLSPASEAVKEGEIVEYVPTKPND